MSVARPGGGRRRPTIRGAVSLCLTTVTLALLTSVPATAGPDRATTATRPTGASPSQVRPAEIHRGRSTPNLTEDESDWRVLLDEYPELEEVWTYSPSMNRDIPLLVLPAGVDNAPTLYMLNGVDGGPEDNNWFGKGGGVEFYSDKGVNVVVPVDGKNSYYTDWLQPSPLDRADRGGLRQQWATYLARELPGPLEEALGANGNRAILGMSMSSTSALLLAQHNPGIYGAVASVSGCADTTSPQGRPTVDYITEDAGATTGQMWGPADEAYARDHDPYLNLGRLTAAHQGRSLPLYVSVASGIPMPVESQATVRNQAIGAALEIGSLSCTVRLDEALDRVGVPATVDYHPRGLHSWAMFAKAPAASWPTVSKGLFPEAGDRAPAGGA
ncbi:alpha/beta hydrolase family protein [Corynebacterium sp. USCH3]|uniref:alpha/beta hydrolase n=1 Tax=Corynebacterium sp. USCH3 TaxID=3024840 RepID=UPI0030B6836F